MKHNKIILISGGARSGKSLAAEKMVCSSGSKPFYIATCPVIDGEMSERVQRHQQRREADNWQTIEEQLDLVKALEQARDKHADAVLIDCLTLWINNLLYHNPKLSEDALAEKAANLVKSMKTMPFLTVLVISEVGLGLVPESALARRFRDLSGRCAQIIAAAADEVYFSVAGIQQRIK
ncbi:MAG: bifunctional adenosylcobinamide kinase/adenosylcobinamide-phosphate guanylyltransferase [Victivallales bacterium]|nr:bifunctional adenosylcobinamide kinase/adenosylcobinamide-phosphate guanylyltransferase [Victivallales bacterium]